MTTQHLYHTTSLSHNIFITQHLYHTTSLSHNIFITQHLYHTTSLSHNILITQHLYHTTSLSHNIFITQHLYHTTSLSHDIFITQHLYHTTSLSHNIFITQHLYHTTSLSHIFVTQAGHSKLVQTPGSHQTIVTGNGGPSGTGKRCVGEPILPPPVFLQDIIQGVLNSFTSNLRFLYFLLHPSFYLLIPVVVLHPP